MADHNPQRGEGPMYETEPTETAIAAQNRREDIAREQYIAWRMRDLPAIYSNLMPVTCDAKTLWYAERCIRAQVKADQEHLAKPWRQIGPACSLLDLSDLSAEELIQFGAEVSIPAGLRDAPKPGREDELKAEIEAQRAGNPAYAAAQAQLQRTSQRQQGGKISTAPDLSAGDDSPRRREKLL